MADSNTKNYRDPLIAMAVLACVFFLIIVIIVVLWCKNRRQVEVKTVTVQPKKKPVPTRLATANKNGQSASNGGKPPERSVGVTDVEATISLDDDTPPQMEHPTSTITHENEAEASTAGSPANPTDPEPETQEQMTTPIIDEGADVKETNPIVQKDPESEQTEAPSESKGETNESFQPDV